MFFAPFAREREGQGTPKRKKEREGVRRRALSKSVGNETICAEEKLTKKREKKGEKDRWRTRAKALFVPPLLGFCLFVQKGIKISLFFCLLGERKGWLWVFPLTQKKLGTSKEEEESSSRIIERLCRDALEF